MIHVVMSKKDKRRHEQVADREITTEADYFARRCGLTREEAQGLLDQDTSRLVEGRLRVASK